MMTCDTSKIEPYLQDKGLRYRKRGQKAELDVCPFCHGGDSTDKKTFVVYLDGEGGNYKCMRGSCGATGSFWQLIEHYGDNPKDFYHSNGHTNGFTKRNGHKAPPKTIQPKYKSPEFVLRDFTPEALNYLHLRGFSDAALDSLSVGCDEKGNIAFEYHHKGQQCFVKLREPRKPEKGQRKAWALPDGLRVLWSLEHCDFSLPFLVITMGEYDCISVRQSRIANAVSIPSGDEDFAWIDLCWDDLQKFASIIVWPDQDISGLQCLDRIADRLGKDRVRVVKTDFKDANEMLFYRTKAVGQEKAEDEIYEAIVNAAWYFTSDLIQVVDIPDKEQDFTGYLTGFSFLNRSLHGFLKGQLTVHVGDSKSGKSTALTQIAATCIEQGASVCAWSGEDDEYSFKYRMDVHLGGYQGTEIKLSKAGREYAILLPNYRPLVDQFIRDRLFLLNKRFGVDEHSLVESFTLAHRRHGCDVFIVDNLMKIVTSKDTQQIFFRQAQIISKLSDFAKENGVHVHVAAHINKGGVQIEPPTKNAVSGAKEITNLADIVLSWWRVPDAVKSQHDGADALCAVLANRVFGDEPSQTLRYDWRIKRFGESTYDLAKIYIGEGYNEGN